MNGIMKNSKGFMLRVLAMVLCAVISSAAFYIPEGVNVRAEEDTELRGVWVSTVANIDYPSRQTTNSEILKSEMIEILDNCKSMGFNAVFLQVRPCGDAFYNSSVFPWSKYLTGTQGVAPDNGLTRCSLR